VSSSDSALSGTKDEGVDTTVVVPLRDIIGEADKVAAAVGAFMDTALDDSNHVALSRGGAMLGTDKIKGGDGLEAFTTVAGVGHVLDDPQQQNLIGAPTSELSRQTMVDELAPGVASLSEGKDGGDTSAITSGSVSKAGFVSKPLDHSTAPDNLTLPDVLPHSEVVLLTEYMDVALDDPTPLIISDPEHLVIVGPLTLEEFTSQIGPLTLKQHMHCLFFFFQPCQWGGDFYFDYQPDPSSTALPTILATGTDRDTSHTELFGEEYADSLELD